MFKSLFNKNNSEEISQINTNEPHDRYSESFKALILYCLSKHGVNDNCGKTENLKWDNGYEKDYQAIMDLLGYNELFEFVLLEELDKYIKSSKDPNKYEFINYFTLNFHHIKISKFTSELIKKRNHNISNAYNEIIECINRIQGWQNNEKLRVKVESDLTHSVANLATISQCTTPFCIVSLGCDLIGRYNIMYSIDHRIKEMIGNNLASILIRRIYEFTPGAMEPFG